MSADTETITRQTTREPDQATGGRSRRQRILVKLAILIVTILVGVVVLEFAARVIVDRDGMNYGIEMWKYAKVIKRPSSNHDMGHEHIPDSKAHLMGVPVQINSQGLRDSGPGHAAVTVSRPSRG